MQYSTLLLALLPAIASAAPALTARQTPSIQDIADAQNQWASDTSKVSQFLSAAPSLSGQDLADQAAAALSSENDELTHKAVLDNTFVFVTPANSDVQNANNILVDQGNFAFVVNGLNDLATNGASFDQDHINAAISNINAVRCNAVLPAIDTYFQAAGQVLQNGVTLQANRPDNCQ